MTMVTMTRSNQAVDADVKVALSYALMPLTFLMGVPWSECRVVGEVVGLKTVLNEFVGYQRLGEYIARDAVSVRKEKGVGVRNRE